MRDQPALEVVIVVPQIRSFLAGAPDHAGPEPLHAVQAPEGADRRGGPLLYP